MKILIIEDEENLAKLLKVGLEREGYAVDYVLDGDQGQRRIEMHHMDYDLVVCDLMLPKKNGLEICKNIRAYNISLPILVLTARDSVEDKVSLLDAGADDYIVKPFHFNEVLARIRALTRRPEKVLPTELKVGDLTLDAATRKTTNKGKNIELTLKEFRLLEYFMRHPNKALKREDIIENIWDFDFDSMSNVIDVYINRLREKIGDKSSRVIETVRGVGYRLKV